MKRAMFVIGATVGYVLGARAGRERYEHLKASAQELAEAPATKQAIDAAQQGLDRAVDALYEMRGQVEATTRELPERLVHTKESLKAELTEKKDQLKAEFNTRAESLRNEIAEANARTRERQASTLFAAGDLRDGALDDLGNGDDAMLDEHGADNRNLSE